MEINEGYGTIVEKSEGVDKNDKKFWKFRINVDDEENTFGLFEYDAGLAVDVKKTYYMTWTEKEAQGQFGKIIYRTIKSIGEPKQYEKDPVLAKKTDKQLADEAPSESMRKKDIVHGERKGGGSSTYNEGARIGCILRHAPVRDGAAKGKIERFFRRVRDQFLIRNLDLSSLQALNRQFTEWVENNYNNKTHSAIGMNPVTRFNLDIKRIKFLEPNQVNDELFVIPQL